MSKFRKGDLVLIEAEVSSNFENDGVIRVHFDGNTYDSKHVQVATLTMKRPNFEVGDEVSWEVNGLDYYGHVLSVHGDHVWIDRGDGEFATVWVDKITRVEPEPVLAADAEEAPPPVPHEAEAAE